MAHTEERLNAIFTRTDGRCHLCWGGIDFSRYGDHQHARGWEVDHSDPRASGGTDRLNNLLPAHALCNRSKGARRNREIRGVHGRSRAPMPAGKQAEVRAERTVVGGVVGGLIGMFLAEYANSNRPPERRVNPLEAAVSFGILGATINGSRDPES